MPKTKREYVEVSRVATIPSPNGDFDVVFRICRGDNGLFFDIGRWTKGNNPVRIGGVAASLEGLKDAGEALINTYEAMKELV